MLTSACRAVLLATVFLIASVLAPAGASAKPGIPPVNELSPPLSGTAQVEQTLTSGDGTWSGPSPISLSAQWQRCAEVAGIDWTDSSSPGGVSNVDWKDVTYGNGLFVAVGATGPDRVMTSIDGVTWTVHDNPGIDGTSWKSVAYGNGVFVAVATDGTDRVMTSADGSTWVLRDTPGDSLSWGAVTYGDGKFVAGATGSPFSFMSSTDGITWTVAGAAATSTYGLTYGGGKFVGVGYQFPNDGTSVSSDGSSWSTNPAPTNLWWQGVTYANGRFVAVGSNIGTDTQRIMTSTDGITWASATSAEVGGAWTAVDFGEGLFAARALSSVAMYSANGLDWKGDYDFHQNMSGMVFGGDRFVAVGGNFGAFSYSGVSTSDCEDIPGETGGEYTPTLEDVGLRIRVKETATNTYGSTVAYSAPSEPVIPDVAELAVTSSGGTVTSSPAGINCGSTCSFEFPFNEEVTLTATPDAGKNIIPGSSSCPGGAWTESQGEYTCTVTMDEVREASVAFRAPTTLYVYNANPNFPGSGGSCSDPDYETVPAAEAAAISGDTIHICDGSYTGVAPNDKALTFEGEGADKTTITHADCECVGAFFLTGDSVNSTFRDMTISGGDGGIVALAKPADANTLTVENVSFEGNDGYRGGGISAQGVALNISGSTFTGNSAIDAGAAIYSQYAPVTLVNSTISGNSLASGGDGDLNSRPRGAAIANKGIIATATEFGTETPAHITLNNVTIGDNELDGGASLFTYCDGDGSPCPEADPASSSGDIKVSNTIMAENGVGCATAGTGVITGFGGNVIQDTTTGCDALIGGATAPDTTVPAGSVALGQLAVNPPGKTATMALGTDSVAIGIGNSELCPETDQRGVVRPEDCDSGAYQTEVPPEPPVNTEPPSISGNPEVGQTLTGDQGVWTGKVPISYEYQWQRCEGEPGVDWTSRSSAVDNMWNSVAWGGPQGEELFVATSISGTGNRVMTSPDGVTWTARTPAANNNWISVVWGGPEGDEKFVAVADTGSGNRVMTSPDGISWTIRSSPADLNWYGLTWGGPEGDEKFVAVAASGSGNRVMTSPDGINWTLRSSAADNFWIDVVWGGPAGDEKFVAVAFSGSGNRVMTSPDGVTWSSQVSAADNDWISVAWGGPAGDEKFVAVAFSGSGNRVMTSPDGINWTLSSSAADNEWTSVVWGGPAGEEQFVAVSQTGSGNRVMTSPDGVNWTSRESAADNSWRAVAWGGPEGDEKFVAVALSGAGNRVMTSGLTCTDISDAKASTYSLVGADEGKRIRLKITGANSDGSTEAFSELTEVIQPLPLTPPINASPPSISGKPQVGKTLKVKRGTWSGNPTPTVSLRWLRCDAAVPNAFSEERGRSACVEIPGANGTSYKLTDADKGFTIRVQETATNSQGTGDSFSNTLGPVTGAPVPSGKPKLKVNVKSPKRVRAGNPFTIRVKVTNRATPQESSIAMSVGASASTAASGTTAKNVRTCVKLPSAVVLVNRGGARVQGKKICWKRASLAAGKSVNYSFRVRSVGNRGVFVAFEASTSGSNSNGVKATANGNSKVKVIPQPKPQPKPKPPTG